MDRKQREIFQSKTGLSLIEIAEEKADFERLLSKVVKEKKTGAKYSKRICDER
jgi:hypothetical protein